MAIFAISMFVAGVSILLIEPTRALVSPTGFYLAKSFFALIVFMGAIMSSYNIPEQIREGNKEYV